MRTLSRVFITIALLMIYSPVYSLDASPFLTLSYGGETNQGNPGTLCPKYKDVDGNETKSVYVASAEAGVWVRMFYDVYAAIGYNYTGCVFNKGEVISAPYIELQSGSKKWIKMAVMSQDENIYTKEAYFYRACLGGYISESLSANVCGWTGKAQEGEKQIRNYTLMFGYGF